ncbi:PREDICTED: dihydropteridine reductase [Nicrophorus vespilloides]|uniref:Dihydropteridine reductase n=1 Tax=Nicrophorus vespilloides TaxID=110193 RepID=A0ABM1NKB5_NICVS|nr:PREDICTED: dihydropteridine reductase [Nicrophorus vespilloides]
MAQVSGRVVIYGGRGALGSKCVQYFKAQNFWVGSIDMHENQEADVNIVVDKDSEFSKQESTILNNVSSALAGSKLDAIICVAGGWAGGNASKDLIKHSDLMWRQSVWSSLISASIASQYLKDGGLLTLTGAKAALDPTPGMIGYGMAKAAVHHLVKSLAAENSGLPTDTTVTAILPITLDTPMNRKWMPNSDYTTWTPLEFIAEKFLEWTKNENRPANGSLCQLITKESNTNVVPV